MTKPTVNKISDKLAKASDTFTVNIFDNGFMVEISGQTAASNWATAKIACPTMQDLMAVIAEAAEMERD